MVSRDSDSDNQRFGGIVNRTSATIGKEKTRDVTSYGALKTILDLLPRTAELRGSAPLMQTRTASGWKVITPTIVTKALRGVVSSLGRSLEGKQNDTREAKEWSWRGQAGRRVGEG